MIRIFTTAAVLLSFATATLPAHAQEGALGGAIIGGAAGAIIGGAATGRAGGAAAGAVIGGATGAIIGSQADRPRARAGYFWSGDRCFYQHPNGQVQRVQRRHCY